MPEAPTTESAPTRPRGRQWRIRTYIICLAAPILLVQVASALYQRRETVVDSERTARKDAGNLATIAAALIDSDIAGTRADLADRAAAAAAGLDAGCAAAVADAGPAAAGHVDVIDATGVTRCSSLPSGDATTATSPPPWLAQVLRGPAVIAPVTDARTGRVVAVFGAPLADGSAAVVRSVDLVAYGTRLASTLAAGGQYEVVLSDGERIVTTSADPERWTGAPLAKTGFATSPGGGAWDDLAGTARLYGSAALASTGWTVFVGADRAEAGALAERTANHNLIIGVMLLALVLFAIAVVFGQIVNPISRLSARVRTAIATGAPQPLAVSGAREVTELADDFHELVTERERELGEARQLAVKSAAILDAAIDAVVTIDSAGNIVEFNPAAERTFGYRRAEVLGMQMAQAIIPERFRADHLRGLEHYLATGEAAILGRRVELMAMRRDGSELPVELTVTLVDIPGAPLFTGHLRDLTEQVRAREELAASEHRLQVILDNSPALVHMKDLDGRYLFINAEGLRAIGRTREEMIGHTDAELFPTHLAEVYRRDDLDTLREMQPRQRERTLPTTDASVRTVLSTKFPLIDADGVPYGTAGISTDITDRKRVEAERRFLQERLDQSQRLESLGQLAGGVAHDFNNLLAVILIHAKFVADQTEGQVHEDVEQIRIAAERAAGLTRQLLVFGRRERVNPQPIDLGELIAGVHDVLARGIGLQIELVVEADDDVPPVLADRGQMEQVLLNLAINARDAMPDGGTLTFRVEAGEGRELGAVAPGGHVRLTVTDTGSGMSPEVAARAFEPFFTTKPPGQGTGLGLATVYGIISEAGGTIELESTPGTGTTFRIVIPAANSGVDGVAAPVVASAPFGQGQTVLVVDDEPALLAVTVRMLEDGGYDVISAGSAEEALARAQGEELDLLLTDFVMPKVSGSQLAEQLRRQQPGLAVLLMSGYSHGLSNHEPLGDDTLRVLHKPFSEHALLMAVHEVLTTR